MMPVACPSDTVSLKQRPLAGVVAGNRLDCRWLGRQSPSQVVLPPANPAPPCDQHDSNGEFESYRRAGAAVKCSGRSGVPLFRPEERWLPSGAPAIPPRARVRGRRVQLAVSLCTLEQSQGEHGGREQRRTPREGLAGRRSPSRLKQDEKGAGWARGHAHIHSRTDARDGAVSAW